MEVMVKPSHLIAQITNIFMAVVEFIKGLAK